MTRRPYALLMAVAVGMGAVAIITAQVTDVPLRDPDGFLGPAWVRLPAMVLIAFVADILPRSLWRARSDLSTVREQAAALLRQHWTRERVACVVIGITSFYVTYVSYRNLKNGLLIFRNNTRDPMLHHLDRIVFFGHEPATVLHAVLGETVSAQVLAFVYLFFLPMAPITVVAWVVWSRKVSYGYWFVTAQCLCWALGTLSYYAIPTLGPNFYYVWLYADLPHTGVSDLQNSLWNGRYDVFWNPFAEGVQSMAGFASLHCAIVLCVVLVAHYTLRSARVRWALWVYFGLTVLSTLYFGWHYVADDIAGCAIAVFSVWLAGLATGNRLDRRAHQEADAPLDGSAELAPGRV
jgi:hypothetical protein